MNLAEPSPHAAGAIHGLAPLLKRAFLGADLIPLASQWIEDARHCRNANTLMDLSIVLELLKKPELAKTIRCDALQLSQSYRIAAQPRHVALRLLVLKTPGDLSANTPVECLLEDSDIAVEILYVDTSHPLPKIVPEHDLLFVAIAESNANRPTLEYLDQYLALWPGPYLNIPAGILSLERNTACTLLQNISGVLIPMTALINRATLQQLANDQLSIKAILPEGEFPVIVRPVDSHAGRGLIKVESPADLLPWLDERPEADFFISRFIDYSSADGLFRKYRIVVMQGKPFLCHMGISSHWMVHYPYPEMIANPVRREEEQQAMLSFEEDFLKRHGRALAAIHEKLSLDYFGLDCAETPDGDLLIFEPASAMLVHAMDLPDLFPYKQVQMRKVIEAFRTMLKSNATCNSRSRISEEYSPQATAEEEAPAHR